MDLITVDDSGGDDQVSVSDVTVDVTRKRLTLEDDLSGILDSGEQAIITIKGGVGIETPETPQGFDNLKGEDPYEVNVIFVDGDDASAEQERVSDTNFVIVKNPLSSTVPGATVRVVLATHAEQEIETTDEIVVDFSGPSADSGFSVPSSIATSRIQVRYQDGSSTRTFNPAEVQVQENG